MATVDRTRQYLSAYRSAVIVGAVGASLTITAGVTEDRSPPPRKPPRIISDGHTVTPPPVTVTTTETATVIATPTELPSPIPTQTVGPSMLPSSLPSSVPSAIASPTLTPTVTTVTPSPTLTPRNHANGLKPPWCVIAVDHHGQVIKRPCKDGR